MLGSVADRDNLHVANSSANNSLHPQHLEDNTDEEDEYYSSKTPDTPRIKSAFFLHHDVRSVFEKFMTKFEAVDAATYESVEQLLSEFSIKELSLLQRNVMHTKEISLASGVRRTIQLVAKRAIIDKNLNKCNKSLALADIAKFCKIFYQTPKLPPINKPVVAKARTSRTLILEEDKQYRNKSKKAHPATNRCGYKASTTQLPKKIEEVNTDPQDLFIANLENSLPRVAIRNYNSLKKKQQAEKDAIVALPPTSDKITKAYVSPQKAFGINLKRDNTFYINCGLNIFKSYNKKIRERQKRMGEEKLKKQRSMSPKALSPPPVFITTFPIAVTEHHRRVGTSKYSTTSSAALLMYEEELVHHWNRIGDPYMKDLSSQRQFIEKRFAIFKDKVKYIYCLMCMMRNIKLFHLRQERLTMQVIWSLRADPFTSKFIGIKRARNELISSKHNFSQQSNTQFSLGTQSGMLSGRSLSSRRRKTSLMSLSSGSLSSTSVRTSRNPVMAQPLETWEDFLAVNPKDDYKPARRSKRNAYSRLARPVSSLTTRQAIRRIKVLPPKSVKFFSPFWKILRKHFVVSHNSNSSLPRSTDGSSMPAAGALANVIGADITTFKKRVSVDGSTVKVSHKYSALLDAFRHKLDTEGDENDPEDDLDLVSKLKIEWLKTKIMLTAKIQKKLRRQYRNTVNLYKEKRNRFLSLHEMRRQTTSSLICRRDTCRVRFFQNIETRATKLDEKQEIWDSMLVTESNIHRLYTRQVEMQSIDNMIDKIQRFSTATALKDAASREEKMKLLVNSVPAYELLTLPTQIAFKFVLGNVLFIDPDIFETWMKNRGLSHHPGLYDEPVMPEMMLNDIRAEKVLLTKEIINMFNEAGVKTDKL